MNRLVHIAVAGALLVFGAAAQDAERTAKLKAELEANVVQMKMVGAVRGTSVKGAPYSAEAVNETNQMLADGTRIHRENRTTDYSDSDGRTRSESPDSVTITDPVANVTYLLNPKTMTGQKLTMSSGSFSFVRSGSMGGAISGDSTSVSIHSSGDGPATIIVNGVPLDEKAVAEAMAKAKASGYAQTITYESREVTTAVGRGSGSGSGGGSGFGGSTGTMGGTVMGPITIAMRKSAGEPLGKQMIEGVNAEGTREVSTIAAGGLPHGYCNGSHDRAAHCAGAAAEATTATATATAAAANGSGNFATLIG